MKISRLGFPSSGFLFIVSRGCVKRIGSSVAWGDLRVPIDKTRGSHLYWPRPLPKARPRRASFILNLKSKI